MAEAKKQRRIVKLDITSTNLGRYIQAIVKDISSDKSISSSALNTMSNICKSILEKVMVNANMVISLRNVKTLKEKQIRSAVALTLSDCDELLKLSLAEGDKAVKRYNASGSEDRLSRSKRAGLTISVSRVENLIRQIGISARVSEPVPVFMAAVLEYLMAEIIELSLKEMKKDVVRIKCRDITLAIKGDAELRTLCHNMVLGGGVRF